MSADELRDLNEARSIARDAADRAVAERTALADSEAETTDELRDQTTEWVGGEVAHWKRKYRETQDAIERVREVVDASYGTCDRDDPWYPFHLGQRDMADRVRVFLPPALDGAE